MLIIFLNYSPNCTTQHLKILLLVRSAITSLARPMKLFGQPSIDSSSLIASSLLCYHQAIMGGLLISQPKRGVFSGHHARGKAVPSKCNAPTPTSNAACCVLFLNMSPLLHSHDFLRSSFSVLVCITPTASNREPPASKLVTFKLPRALSQQ